MPSIAKTYGKQLFFTSHHTIHAQNLRKTTVCTIPSIAKTSGKQRVFTSHHVIHSLNLRKTVVFPQTESSVGALTIVVKDPVLVSGIRPNVSPPKTKGKQLVFAMGYQQTNNNKRFFGVALVSLQQQWKNNWFRLWGYQKPRTQMASAMDGMVSLQKQWKTTGFGYGWYGPDSKGYSISLSQLAKLNRAKLS